MSESLLQRAKGQPKTAQEAKFLSFAATKDPPPKAAPAAKDAPAAPAKNDPPMALAEAVPAGDATAAPADAPMAPADAPMAPAADSPTPAADAPADAAPDKACSQIPAETTSRTCAVFPLPTLCILFFSIAASLAGPCVVMDDAVLGELF
jgi:hypothetical protein